ncbi:LytTR family DNA-binding domain-containing protein [Cellulosilyticum lentocellum]|uniref:Response regulator receiver protein n=1 Tax=Cellulosilyticum lentocellum (strain ATCC 49066 / DSM 5427 / NCIMB 11756 / RHM5) TaxID=642492 RepID=F2JNJ2_CELLD|nr:LytTR family DNA-binding domain-containing protein [Cellulosilyticum lentocellum]ADZ84768.1 response regulator receiver protein [Cellulosilyticum lentocellum DSM 5427]
MKIIIEDVVEGEEETIIIRCHELDEALLQTIYGIKMQHQKIVGFDKGIIHMIIPNEIYYFEAVDNKIFIYCKEKVYESKLKLYEIENMYAHTDFFRASKSIILNLTKIKHLSPAFNGRFEALLDNDEKVIISRQFVPELKRKLGL